MILSDYNDEYLFQLSAIETKVAHLVLPSPVEAISKADKERAMLEGTMIRLSYSLFCQNNAHHNCHSQSCGCMCHSEFGLNPHKEYVKNAILNDRLSDPYWNSRLGKAVGSTNPSDARFANRPRGSAIQMASKERGVSPHAATPPQVVHKAGTELGSRPLPPFYPKRVILVNGLGVAQVVHINPDTEDVSYEDTIPSSMNWDL